MLALAGVAGGTLLGELAVGTNRPGNVGEGRSYAGLSANLDALVPQGKGAAPCPECADSYGVAARLRANHHERMDGEFRRLGTVDVDPPLPDEPADNYRYGGRFPDPEPSRPEKITQAANPPDVTPPGDVPLPDGPY